MDQNVECFKEKLKTELMTESKKEHESKKLLKISNLKKTYGNFR